MTAAVLFMCWEALARYVFKMPVYFTNEWTPFMTTWAMLLGNAILVATGATSPSPCCPTP